MFTQSLWKSIALAAISSSAFAATPSTTSVAIPTSGSNSVAGQSSASLSEESTLKKILKHTHVNAESTLYGPELATMDTNSIPDDAIGEKTGMSLRNKLGAGVKIGRLSITPTADFEYQLTDPGAEKKALRQFRWKDSYLKISGGELASANIAGSAFSLGGDVRLFAPTSLGARQSDTIGAVRLTVAPSLQLGQSKFSISNATFAKFWIQQNEVNPITKRALPRWEVYTGPQLNFTPSDKVNFFVLGEMDVVFNTFGQSNYTNVNQSNMDLEPGIDFQVSKNVTLTPFLNIYLNQGVETASMNLQANIRLL